MALGAMTSNVETAARGPIFIDDVSQVGDAAYPTGGSLGMAAKLKALRKDGRVILDVKSYVSGGYHVQYNASADTLKVFTGTTGVDAEVANATDLSGTTFKFVITSQ